MNTKQRKRGRPTKRTMREPIPDTPENIARAIVTSPPEDEWRHLQDDDG